MARETLHTHLEEVLRAELMRTPPEPVKGGEKTPEILDLKDESIFDPAVLEKIRLWAVGKKIAVFDVHGVLLSHQFNSANPDAEEILDMVTAEGITPVAWSYDSAYPTKDALFRARLLKYFDLLIFGENYRFPSSKHLQSFVAVTPRTPEVYKKNPLRLQGRKNPDIFNTFTVVVDDDLGHYPSQLVKSENHQFFQVVPFTEPLLVKIIQAKFGNMMTTRDRPKWLFNKALVAEILRAFE